MIATESPVFNEDPTKSFNRSSNTERTTSMYTDEEEERMREEEGDQFDDDPDNGGSKKSKKKKKKDKKTKKLTNGEADPNAVPAAWGSAPADDDSSSSDSGSRPHHHRGRASSRNHHHGDESNSNSHRDEHHRPKTIRFDKNDPDQTARSGIEDFSSRSYGTRHSMGAAASPVTTPTPLVETHVAVRVIKGEIHNVLSVMRSSESGYISGQRFHQELPDEHHPIVQVFSDMHSELSDWDLQMAVPHTSMLPKKQLEALRRGQQERAASMRASGVYDDSENGGEEPAIDPWVATPNAMMYLPPFCNAVTGREISAPVTGAALSALHKFLIYGFVHPNVAPNAKAGMTMIANALLNCTFEETYKGRDRRRNGSNASSRSVGLQGQSSRSLQGQSSRSLHHQASSSSVIGFGGGGGGRSSSRSNSSHSLPYYHPTRVDDEQVVLKLLDLAAMVVRCSFILRQVPVDEDEDFVEGNPPQYVVEENCLISSDMVVGLLDTCLHVSHIAKSASPLLKSAAMDSLSQIVLQVFAGSGAAEQGTNGGKNRGVERHPEVVKARQEVLAKLASLLDPSSHSEDVIVSSLTAVNIALETSRENLTAPEIVILQNDLCKYLLQWSTTSDLHILALTLRVIFNLFQSIQNHLKVPLEVFLTSVHLRILELRKDGSIPGVISQTSTATAPTDEEGQAAVTHTTTTTPLSASATYANYEEREVVLESLVEFCAEPALMQDIYRNYDCDVACTNLFEKIVSALAKCAMPNDVTPEEFFDAFYGDGKAEFPTEQVATQSSFFTVNAAPAPVTQLNKLAIEGLLGVLNSIARRVHADRSPFLQSLNNQEGKGIGLDSLSDDQEQMTEDELLQRKQQKQNLVAVAEAFNEKPFKQAWIEKAVELEILDTVENAKGVAQILYMASNLDKAKVGEYLSKGPEEDYPFNTKVRQFFISMFDFTEMGFAAALRLFLSKFRLPGEAQCIDRFMEGFANELYRQQGGDNSFFKNSDAVYVLSFSTIMLNTDLHNPMINDENRMTKQQFINNNRGINGGEDFPPEYLSLLYDQIKEQQIQVQRDVGEFMKKEEDDEDFRSAWDSILAKHREVAAASFTPAGQARRNIYKAGIHDREMFTVLVRYLRLCLPAVFARSMDDVIVFKTLRGLKQMAMCADYFDMPDLVNDTIEHLLVEGREYVVNVIIQEHSHVAHHHDARETQSVSSRSLGSVATTEDDESAADDTTYADEEKFDSQIPYSLLSTGKGYSEIDYTGASNHRGLLAMDTGFLLVRRYARKVITAWPIFIECLCAMRDARALPKGLSELDDFADANGNVLPLSPYARVSQKRLDDFYTIRGDPEGKNRLNPNYLGGLEKEQSWFSKLWRGSESSRKVVKSHEEYDADNMSVMDFGRRGPQKNAASEAVNALLAVAEEGNVERIVQMGSTKLPVAEQTIRSLMDVVDDFPYSNDPVAEQHAIFSLELAARALLSNRERAVEIFPLFLKKFESVLGKIEEKRIPSPFVIERIVVTILRCSIHLYDIEELRPNLRVSLHLLVMSIPKNFIKEVADRMACGLAIILRASFPFFESHNEWTFMGDTLDTLANFASARVFVFDGIASTVECAVPQGPEPKNGRVEVGFVDDDDDDVADEEPPALQYPLTKEACGALSRILIRFVLGFYQSDFSLCVPASVCLEKLYRHMNSLVLDEMAEAAAKDGKEMVVTEEDRRTKVPNKDYWQNVGVALYSVCRSPDPEVSRHGYEICNRVVLRAPLREIPCDKWMAILYLMVNKQPPSAADLSRANTFVLLGNTLMRVLPYLSKRQRKPDDDEDADVVEGEDLSDLVRQTAALTGENLRMGRRGGVSPLFEKTLQTVTYLSNHMVTDEWKGDKDFGEWSSETLLAELEKVGAAGGASKNKDATKGKDDDDDDDDGPMTQEQRREQKRREKEEEEERERRKAKKEKKEKKKKKKEEESLAIEAEDDDGPEGEKDADSDHQNGDESDEDLD
eukprot:CAMPEP_0168755206 /NCGR_PEP_ID=MMETSP0724-20121128/19935_1 /TAXON_ID=265536 /ORGANISM="Amphiprora sp., Strain CCMP467" /LENGTH=1976 /DNA_ID=CAMNT_0008803785 /DNA_START=458 /DNA_END=6388 /DNA_ORIENTATION=-